MQKNFYRIQKGLAFSLLELIVVIVIVSIITVVSAPLYKEHLAKSKATKVVNKLSELKADLVEDYFATNSWPFNFNNTDMGATSTDTTFDYATNFHYNSNTIDKAWLGYQLSDDYGGGWIFILIIKNAGIFEVHCGSLEADCGWGACDSGPYYPSGCQEEELSLTYDF